MKGTLEKQIELRAPISRVRSAITDYRQFGEWFGVKLDGPFREAQVSRGNTIYSGKEYVKWEADVQKIEPSGFFSFTWAHPKSLDRATYSPDCFNDAKTPVEFRLEPIPAGTLLRVTESGFSGVPDAHREEAYRRNQGGRSEQVKNIENYLAKQ